VTDIRDRYYGPIHSASKAGDTNLVEYLLSMNANVNSKSSTGTTPLIHAIKSGNIETVQYLITKRANVNRKTKRNRTPLYEAVKGGHKDIFELLLNHGARIQDKEDDGNTLLHAAALSKNVVGSDTTETRILIQDIIARIGVKEINAKDFFGYTPLHYAAQIGNQASVSTLLAVGADLNARTEKNQTYLELNHLELNQTPLELTFEAKNLATAKQLLVAGANLNKCFFGYRHMQDKLLKLILFILEDKEEIVGENIILVNNLIKKAEEITLRKLVINVLTANPQTVSPQLKCFCDRLIKEHNIQSTDCLARVIADYQTDYQLYDQTGYQLDEEEILSFVYQLIELYGVSPVDCIYQLILSKKEAADPLLYHLINKYKVSPLHLLNNAITQGREDIVSLLIGPYYKSIKNIIIKQCIAANDFRVISHLIQYDKNNRFSNNVNCIISQAIKLNELDIVQLLITKCHADARIVVANVIKEISNPVVYNANMHKFVRDLMAANKLQPEDFAIWAAAAGMYDVVSYMLIHYNLSLQQLIDYAIKMNNDQAVSFLKKT
jgi:ankyrin repeat protein